MSQPIVMKGSYFAFERLPDAEVRITWSADPKPCELWDPLDFWIVPEADVDATVERLREGVTL